MPGTPVYGITFPCLSPAITAADFASFATTAEAALNLVTSSTAAGVDSAQRATHMPTARGIGAATPAFGVEATFLFTLIPSSVTSNGIALNTGTGVFGVLENGFYMASTTVSGSSSTLTMTSQRVAVYVNGVLYAAVKVRGRNPVSFDTAAASYDLGLNLAAGDQVTFRYVWTGTGALGGPAGATCSLSLISRT